MICPRCKKNINENTKFCGNCGNSIHYKKRNPLNIFIYLILLILVIFLILLLITIYTTTTTNKKEFIDQKNIVKQETFIEEPIHIVSGTFFDSIVIGDNFKYTSINDFILENHNDLDLWNYRFIDKNNPKNTLSLCVKNDIIKAISFYTTQDFNKNQSKITFIIDNKKIILNQTSKEDLKKIFPENEDYLCQVDGFVNIKNGIDFHFYSDQYKDKPYLKSIVIFEKGNSFLYDNLD